MLSLAGEGPMPTSADRIYAAYPRKVGKADALKAIDKALLRLRGVVPDPAEWLLGRVQAYAASPHVRTTEHRFIPHPATWMNQGRYDDDPAEWGLAPKAPKGRDYADDMRRWNEIQARAAERRK